MPPLRIVLVNTKVPRSTKALVAGVRAQFAAEPAIVQPLLDSIDAVAARAEKLFQAMHEGSIDSSEAYSKLEVGRR